MPPFRPERRPSATSAIPRPRQTLKPAKTTRKLPTRKTMPLFPRSIPALRLSANPTRNDELNAFLSSDAQVELELEESFASNMSLNSPPHRRGGLQDASIQDDSRDYVPMDISPAPQRVFYAAPKPMVQPLKAARNYERDTNHTMHLPLPAMTTKITGRPRSNTGSSARLFGKDVSNAETGTSKSDDKGTDKGGKKLQRAALPFEWMSAKKEPEPKCMEPPSPSTDAMDIDMSYGSLSSSAPDHPSPISAAPTVTRFTQELPPSSSAATDIDGYFYRPPSPLKAPDFTAGDASTSMSFEAPAHKKRRSLSPDAVPKRRSYILPDDEALDSSPALMSSPSAHKLERIASKPLPSLLGMVAGQRTSLPLNANNKRPRRPVLSAVVTSGDMADALQSAHPDMESHPFRQEEPKNKENLPRLRPSHLQPVRRAFSAMIPANINPMESFEGDDSASMSMDGPDMSSPVQAYSKRQQVKTLRRRDGTDDFRSVTSALNREAERNTRKSDESPRRSGLGERDTPRSKYLNAPGPGKLGSFGDNESHGKVLPCHRVREDGLMRISCQTLDALLDGRFDSQIYNYHIIDCRFDYEYNGGHIPGAININTTTGVEDFLLGASVKKPVPSLSGDGVKKTILIFHCEFSCKRAPTFAKHLRSKDRMLNNQSYPKIHYPEVYILEGGYCAYYKTSGTRCQPSAYVRMDDPQYAQSRREDLDQFRKGKFVRTRSYAYGEGKNGLTAALAPQAPKRNSAPTMSGAVNLFAAGNIARTRRNAGMLQTLQEDSIGSQQTDDEDTDADIGDSPCPPPTKAMPMFKGGRLARAPLARAETYGGQRMSGLGY